MTEPQAHRERAYEAEDEIDLAQLWGILSVGKWKIAAFTAAALACAIFYLFAAQPTYRADALLQIQTEGSSALQGLMELQQLTGEASTPAEAEIQIVKSRAVLGETVDKLNLDVTATPRYFPVIGQAIARRRQARDPVAAPVAPDEGTWLTHYAWAPVALNVSRTVIPKRLYGEELTLRSLGGGEYELYGPEGEHILRGRAGESALGQTEAGEDVRLFVTEIADSAPPTDFTVRQRPWLPVVQSLQSRLNVSEQGRDTGVVSISLEGEERGAITAIVNAVADSYLRQNVEARSQQAQRSLEFLNEQLPQLRAGLEAAETRLADYREKNQAVDLDAEGQALLDQLVSVEEKRSQLEMKLAELRQTYTGEHPALEAVEEQAESLRRDRRQLEEHIGTLPAAQKEILSLRREVEVNTALYTALLNRAQELRVVKAGTVGNVRIIDRAVLPFRAVSPKTGMVLLLSLILGGMLGTGFVFLQAAMRRGVDDPHEIENRLGLPVYAVIPFSGWLARYSGRARKLHQRAPVLARDHSDEVAVEALRSLRTSLYFAQMNTGSNVVLITGPSPGVGKSFVSMNLAYLLAEVGKKVVVIDADMRKGRLHEFVGSERSPGLSQVLTEQATLKEALRDMDGSEIKVLTSGQLPPNPSELLMRETFTDLLEQLKKDYDLVLVDAPPILAVTDAAIIAAAVPDIITFMVARAGAHPIPELEESVKRMVRQDRKISGVIFNALKQSHATYAGGYSYYQYEYKSQA